MSDWVRTAQLTATPWCSESNKNILFTTNLLLERLIGEHLNLTRSNSLLLRLNTSLLGQELRQAVNISASIVILWCLAFAIEVLNRRESLNTKSLSQALLTIRIDLRNCELVLCEREVLGELLVDGSKILAVTAPWCKEFDEGGLAVQGELVEV
jgi:hypothetical protein